jgi:hypothetical protein
MDMSPPKQNIPMNTHLLILLASLAMVRAEAQSVLFDFDNAPVHTSLPLDLTVDGITARFSSTGLGGYSIQPANTLGFVPAGFAGSCLYPNGINAADLHVGFSAALTDFSILYAPHELACDSSATLRVTTYFTGTFVATATTNATWNCTCTWTSQLLTISSAEPFDSVAVHYEAPASGCEDFGTIFLADNMMVTPAPLIILSNPARLADGAFQFTFTNTPGAPCAVFGTTNVALPFNNWTLLPGPTEGPPGQFQFVDSQATNTLQRFYRVRSP